VGLETHQHSPVWRPALRSSVVAIRTGLALMCGAVDWRGMALPSDNSSAYLSAAEAAAPAHSSGGGCCGSDWRGDCDGMRRGRGSCFAEARGLWPRLRAPDGCPWDREQSFDSIRKYTLEETTRFFDAIERRDFPHWLKSWAICCCRCLFYAEMAANEGHFHHCRGAGSFEPQAGQAASHVGLARSFAGGGQCGGSGCGCRRFGAR